MFTIRHPYTYQGLSNHFQADLNWCDDTFMHDGIKISEKDKSHSCQNPLIFCYQEADL
jgi:hypothetical protein